MVSTFPCKALCQDSGMGPRQEDCLPRDGIPNCQVLWPGREVNRQKSHPCSFPWGSL